VPVDSFELLNLLKVPPRNKDLVATRRLEHDVPSASGRFRVELHHAVVGIVKSEAIDLKALKTPGALVGQFRQTCPLQTIRV
jgi:hypothetical protein